MPLLDDLLGPQRTLAPRQEDQLQREQQAAASGQQAAVDQYLTQRRPAIDRQQVDGSSTLRSLLDSITKATPAPTLNSLAAQAIAPTTTSVLPQSLPTAGPASSIIGKRNYKTGRGEASLRATAQQIAGSMGWDASQFAAWDAIINAESGWNPNAQNPTSTAYGLGQFLNSTWKGYGAKTSDGATQLAYMARYIKQRYGTPQRALEFHYKNNYY